MALTALECTKFVFGRGFDPDPTWGAYSAPLDLLAGLRGPSTSIGGAEGKKRGKREKKGRGREREGPPPFANPVSAPGYSILYQFSKGHSYYRNIATHDSRVQDGHRHRTDAATARQIARVELLFDGCQFRAGDGRR